MGQKLWIEIGYTAFFGLVEVGLQYCCKLTELEQEKTQLRLNKWQPLAFVSQKFYLNRMYAKVYPFRISQNFKRMRQQLNLKNTVNL